MYVEQIPSTTNAQVDAGKVRESIVGNISVTKWLDIEQELRLLSVSR